MQLSRDGPPIVRSVGPAWMRTRRSAVVLLALTALLIAAGAAGRSATAHAYSITQSCQSPPLIGLPDDCTGWHTAGVRLTWDWDPETEIRTSGCDTETFIADSPPTGVVETCTVEWTATTLEATTAVRIDTSPPVISGALPARPPDHDGWWTRPVDFAFQATDKTSGVASCDTITYAGPDGRGVQVTGACRDIAGNSAVATETLDYDATPPSVGDLTIARSGRSATLRWRASADAVLVEVVRAAAEDGARASTVYRGSAATFEDANLSDAVGYRYTVTASDEAGNPASVSATAPPLPRAGSGRLLRPANGAAVSRPPVLRWKRVARARYYNVQLFRGKRKILSAWPMRNRLRLERRWTYAGRRRHLTPGTYRWYVWPGRGPRSARRYGKLIGSSSFRFRRAASARSAQEPQQVAPDPAPVTPDPAPTTESAPPEPAPTSLATPAPVPAAAPQPGAAATPAPESRSRPATPVRRKRRHGARDGVARPRRTATPRPEASAPQLPSGSSVTRAASTLRDAADGGDRLTVVGLALLGLVILNAGFLAFVSRSVDLRGP